VTDSGPANSSKQTSPQLGRSRRHWTAVCCLLAGVVLVGTAVVWSPVTAVAGAAVQRVKKLAEYPHDQGAFSQGLVVYDSRLLESTGRYGESTLREIEVATGRFRHNIPLPDNVFAEGVTVCNDSIVQLTWQNGHLITWDPQTMQQTGKVRYQQIDRSMQQGWGITSDDQVVIISDGSSLLRFVDPQTWHVVRRVRVTSGSRAIRNLNELEYVNGEILANIWYSTRIARIDPKSGRVIGWLELKHIVPRSVRRNREAVLNGIAWDRNARKLYVTGKLWPSLFEITFDGLPK